MTRAIPPISPGHSHRQAAVLWIVAFLAFATLYLGTAQRGVNWQDSASRQWTILTGTYEEPLGLALVHPLYTAIGQVIAAIPIGSATARINALSALAMAVALANLTCMMTIFTGRRLVGLATAAMLAVCHTVWWLSTITETYTLNVAFFTAELWMLVAVLHRPRAWVLAILGLVCGLDWSVHNMALLGFPVYLTAGAVLVARRRLPAWSLAGAVAAFFVGAAPMLALIVRQVSRDGQVLAAIHSALFGRYRPQVLNLSLHWPRMRVNAALASLNFMSFLPVFAVIGWASLRRMLQRPAAIALGAITVIELLFVVRYPVPDQFMFILPSLVVIAIAAGVGVATLASASRRWRRAAAVGCVLSILGPPALYAATPHLLTVAGVEVHRRRQLPYRNEMRYWLVPWKQNEHSAARFAREALLQADRDAVILVDRTVRDTLRTAQKVENLAPTVLVTDNEGPPGHYDKDPEKFRRVLGDRTLYVLSPIPTYIPDGLFRDATFYKPPDGVLYEVRWKSQVSLSSASEPTGGG